MKENKDNMMICCFSIKSRIKHYVSQHFFYYIVVLYLICFGIVKNLCAEDITNSIPLIFYDNEKNLVQTSEEYIRARKHVVQSKKENGKAPNLEDFYRIIFDEDYQLAGIERILLWLDVCRIQQSTITKDDIRKIYLAKRESIKDIYTEFTVEDSREPDFVKECKYAIKYNRMFFYERKKIDQDGEKEHRLSALNNADFRYVLFSDSSADAGIQNVNGSEFATDGHCIQMPLVQSMIFDQNVFHLNWQDYDMPMLCSLDWQVLQILEKTELYEGNECLIIASLSEKFYLDINKDFSVCRVDFFDEDDLRNTEIRSVHLRAQRKLHNLVSYGNGIWLPSEVETTYFDSAQKVTSRERIVYNKIQINKGIKDSFFEDVIPDGASVSDGIRHMVYTWGNHPSIGSLIKETVKTKRQTIFRNLSVVLGLCFIACWGIVEWRKSRLLKGEVE